MSQSNANAGEVRAWMIQAEGESVTTTKEAIARAWRDAGLDVIELAAATQAVKAEPSPTAGMSIAQRILHVVGRANAAGYIEFGSIQAVEALVRQVLRDMPVAAHPSTQGLEQIKHEAACFRWLRDVSLSVWRAGLVVFMTDADGCPGEAGAWSDNILTGEKLARAIPVAAQAKQGERA